MAAADRVRINLSGSVQYPWSWQCTVPDEGSYTGECHAEVIRAEQIRPGGDWFLRSWGPTERHATQEAALDAALDRARDIAKEGT